MLCVGVDAHKTNSQVTVVDRDGRDRPSGDDTFIASLEPQPIAAAPRARPEANPLPGRRWLAITIDQTTQVVDMASFRDARSSQPARSMLRFPWMLTAHLESTRDPPQMLENTRIRPDLPAPTGGLTEIRLTASSGLDKRDLAAQLQGGTA